jgi:calcium-dependent protein kinase
MDKSLTKDIKINHENFVKENTGNIKEFYKISSCIGRGAYGEVRKCLHKQSLSMRAVKIINKKYLEDDEREKLLTEINILKNMDHPNILKLHEFF